VERGLVKKELGQAANLVFVEKGLVQTLGQASNLVFVEGN